MGVFCFTAGDMTITELGTIEAMLTVSTYITFRFITPDDGKDVNITDGELTVLEAMQMRVCKAL